MPNFKRFEEIRVWQQARELCKDIHVLTNREPWSKDYRFKSQIESSSGSIMDNIAEGFGRGGNKEFANFCRISKGSSAECRSQIIRALDKSYVNREECTKIYQAADKIEGGLKKLIDHLNNSNRKGPNYNE
jgi:four helix bundle protein